MTTPGPSASSEDPRRARRQLGRVLLLLGVLDLSVLVAVVGIAVGVSHFDIRVGGLLALILLAVGLVLGIRVWLAVRLHRHAGELG